VILLITLDSVLHGQTTIKHYVNERGVWKEAGAGDEVGGKREEVGTKDQSLTSHSPVQ